MAQRTTPGIGLTSDYNLGENGWKVGMDANLLKLSVLINTGAEGFVSALPSVPTEGRVYIVNAGANLNRIAVRDQNAWVFYTPIAGYRVYVKNLAQDFVFSGTSWVPLVEPGEWAEGVQALAEIPDEIAATAAVIPAIVNAPAQATAAALSAAAAEARRGYAEEWAVSPSLISVPAGGDGSTDRSSKWHADRSDAAAIVSSGAMSSLVLGENTFSTISTAQAWEPVAAPDYIRTAGHTTAGDGGGALYKKVGSEPSHAGKFEITLDDAVTVVWYALAEPEINVKALGATGDGTTDDTAALQSAIDTAISLSPRPPICFPAGTYCISDTLIINPASGRALGTVLRGSSKRDVVIKATAAMESMVEYSATSSANYQQYHRIEGVSLDGNGLAERGYYSPFCAHTTFRGLRVVSTTIAAIDWAYGFCNVYDDIELVGNSGDALYLAGTSAQNNAVLVAGCKLFDNDGFGIVLIDSFAVKVVGSTIEVNKKGGIYAVANVLALTVDTCYFENNCEDGFTFSSPAVTVKADIIINGSSSPTTMADASPSSATIVGNFVQSLVGGGGADTFVYAPGADGLTIEGNDASKTVAPIALLSTYGSSSGSSAGTPSGSLRNVHIGQNTAFDTIIDVSPMTYGALSYRERPQGIRSLYASQANLAEVDLNRWVVNAGGGGGVWRRSSTKFPEEPRLPVWEMAYDSSGSSDAYGFSLATADYPDLHNKLMAFMLWTKHGFAGDGNAAVMARGLYLAHDFSSVTDWELRSGIFKFPSSGTAHFGIRKIGVAGTVLCAKPILCELGADVEQLLGRFGSQTVFKGIAAPTVGTWLRGDEIDNISPSAGGVPRWKCVTGGAPGTWKSYGVLAP